jgi:hypothetical protein
MLTQPVQRAKPILETAIERVFNNNTIPSSYRVEVTRPDGTIQIFDDIRKYTKDIVILDGSGSISIDLVSGVKHRYIMYPCHYMSAGGVLCGLRQFQMLNRSNDNERTYALNHRMFEYDWKICVILNETEKDIMAYITSRAEWERGEITAIRGLELQVFLPVPNERGIAVRLMRNFVTPQIWKWMTDCVAIIKRKKNVA